MRAAMVGLVDAALAFCEHSKEVDSFLAAFVLMYGRWIAAGLDGRTDNAKKATRRPK
jgi:hypothetical protein